MAYLVYPIATAKPPYGDVYHDHVPGLVITMAEYETTLRQRRQDLGCGSCNDAAPVVITLGTTRCEVWLETEVLLDELLGGAEEMIAAFDLDDAWVWDWAQDYHGEMPPDEVVLEAPHQVR